MKKLAFLVAFIFAACYRTPAPATLHPQTTVRVDNRGFADMNIYMFRGSERIRLGTAPGLATTVLVIPATVVRDPTQLRFLANPIGGRGQPVTQEITVSAGDEVGLMIPPV